MSEVELKSSTDPYGDLLKALLPAIREAIRAELRMIGPLNQDWYEPAEIAEMSGNRVSAETVRNWFRWG